MTHTGSCKDLVITQVTTKKAPSMIPDDSRWSWKKMNAKAWCFLLNFGWQRKNPILTSSAPSLNCSLSSSSSSETVSKSSPKKNKSFMATIQCIVLEWKLGVCTVNVMWWCNSTSNKKLKAGILMFAGLHNQSPGLTMIQHNEYTVIINKSLSMMTVPLFWSSNTANVIHRQPTCISCSMHGWFQHFQ